MGTLIKNAKIAIHLAGGTTKTINISGHQQNISVNSEYDVALGERANLHAAAQAGQPQFDALMASLTGAWYNQWDALWRNDFRVAMLEFKA